MFQIHGDLHGSWETAVQARKGRQEEVQEVLQGQHKEREYHSQEGIEEGNIQTKHPGHGSRERQLPVSHQAGDGDHPSQITSQEYDSPGQFGLTGKPPFLLNSFINVCLRISLDTVVGYLWTCSAGLKAASPEFNTVNWKVTSELKLAKVLVWTASQIDAELYVCHHENENVCHPGNQN